MTKKADIESAIIQSKRMDIREALRDVLKRYSVNVIHTCTSAEQAIDLINANEKALLVIDWDIGFDIITKTLDVARQRHKIFTRPIILFTKTTTPEVLGTAYEYHINKVYTGDISINRIREILDKMVEDDKLNVPLRSIFVQVAKHRDTGDLEAADKLLEALLKKFPSNPKIITELAENKIMMNKWSKAQELVEPLLAQDPPYVRGLHLLGRCLMKKRDFEGAIAAFSKAKVMNPFNFDRLISLGEAMIQNNDIAGAKANFKEAQKLNTGNAVAKKGEGQCLLLEGEVNEALEVLKDVTNNGSLASLFNSSAILAIKKGNLTAGLNLYDSALKAIPKDKLIHAKLMFNKGIGYRRFQKDREALEAFQDAMQMDPRNEKAKRNFDDLSRKIGLPSSNEPQAAPITKKALAPAAIDLPAPEADIFDSLSNMDEQFDKEFLDDAEFDSANIDDDDIADDDDI